MSDQWRDERIKEVVCTLASCSFETMTMPTGGERHEAWAFCVMEEAYSRRGGLAYGMDAAALLRHHVDQPLSTLARWIVTRAIVSFEWRSQIRVPLFQFSAPCMSPRAEVVAVLTELAPVFDDWEVAQWFVEPNVWLGQTPPIELIHRLPDDVLGAARADRFIARG